MNMIWEIKYEILRIVEAINSDELNKTLLHPQLRSMFPNKYILIRSQNKPEQWFI